MSKKLPSFQFYTGDWMKDPALRAVSLSARGLWVDMLCLMFESARRGYLVHANGNFVSSAQLARMVGCACDEVDAHLKELEDCGVFSRTKDGIIYNRRMERDERKRQLCVEAGKRGGNPILIEKGLTLKGELKGEVNPGLKPKLTPSSSSSSSSSKQLLCKIDKSNFANKPDFENSISKNPEPAVTEKKKSKRKPDLSDDEWLTSLKNNPAYSHINFEVELGKLDAWLQTARGRGKQKTRARILYWLNGVERPLKTEDPVKQTEKPTLTTNSVLPKPLTEEEREKSDAARIKAMSDARIMIHGLSEKLTI